MDRDLRLAVLTGGSQRMFDCILPNDFEYASNMLVGAMSHGGLIPAPKLNLQDRDLLRQLIKTNSVYESGNWDNFHGFYLLVLHTCIHTHSHPPYEEFIGVSTLKLYRVSIPALSETNIEIFSTLIKTLDREDIFNPKKLKAFLDQSNYTPKEKQ